MEDWRVEIEELQNWIVCVRWLRSGNYPKKESLVGHYSSFMTNIRLFPVSQSSSTYPVLRSLYEGRRPLRLSVKDFLNIEFFNL